jgi:DNA polymerase III subunit epsilon
VFAEVADGFMQFMGDGIFVAHSVNFDYGFISYEYERLERRFRFPKLCTCAGMRRRYPGHQSYSLGNLCETYDIDLKKHHRALCDARATAQLLNLINQQREGRAETGRMTLNNSMSITPSPPAQAKAKRLEHQSVLSKN